MMRPRRLSRCVSNLSQESRDISDQVHLKAGAGSAQESTEGPIRVIGAISSVRLAFLLAGHPLLENDHEPVLQSDMAVFALRISMIANYGLAQLLAALCGCVYYYFRSEQGLLICAVHSVSVVVIFCGVHLVNRFRWMSQRDVFQRCTVALVLLNLCVGPTLLQIIWCQSGLHWSAGAMLWLLAAPMGTFLLTDNPAIPGCVVTLAMVVMMVALMVAFAILAPPLDDEFTEPSFALFLLGTILTWGSAPTSVVAMFRWQCIEHRSRLEVHHAHHLKLSAVRGTLETLIHSIIPERKVKQLPGIMPERWLSSASDEFPECTLLQMDVVGFTELSSRLAPEEVVELIQSVFVSIDYAAHCDCYKAIIGGPRPCSDHAVRGMALAHSILSLSRSIAKRLKVRIGVRVGVHTGSATAAVVGMQMPRYLVFGRDCEIVKRLEQEAALNSVLISHATAAAVSEEDWPRLAAPAITLADGTQVQAFCSSEEAGSGAQTESALQAQFPRLAAFLSDFSHSMQPGHRLSLPAQGPSADEEASWQRHASAPAQYLVPEHALPHSASALARHLSSPLPDDASPRVSVCSTASASSPLALASRHLSPDRIHRFASAARTAVRGPPAPDADSSSLSIWIRSSSGCSGSCSRVSPSPEPSLAPTLTGAKAEIGGLNGLEDRRLVVEGAPGFSRLHSVAATTLATVTHEVEGLSELLGVTEAGGSPTASPGFQRAIAKVFLIACAITAALQSAVLLGLASARAGGLSWHAPLFPALLLLLLAAAIPALFSPARSWASGRPQAAATVLLFLGALVLAGPSDSPRAPLVRWPALLWAFLGVLVQCAATNLSSRAWMLSHLFFLALVTALAVMVEEPRNEAIRGVGWWRELMMGWSLLVCATLSMLPLGAAAMAVLSTQRRARELLLRTRRHLEVEDALVAALAPPALSRRFLSGEQVVADDVKEGTVMFMYLVEYDEMVLRHGAAAAIAWVNAIFARVDACIGQSAVTKVESFNNFVLVFSTKRQAEPACHVRSCLRLALHMLAAAQPVLRPDGTPTLLSIGVSAGPFTARIIGLQSPRYSIFGDTVNTASRMASTSAPATSQTSFVHISPSAWALMGKESLESWMQGLGEGIHMREREKMEIKGKGLMQTYCLSNTPALPEPASAALGGAEPEPGSEPEACAEELLQEKPSP